MCGITGGVWTDPRRAISSEVLRSMTDVLHHRGPDDRGEWQATLPGYLHHAATGVALGFRDMSIVRSDV